MIWTKELIRENRRKYQLTQLQLAALLGCRQQTVSEWELGAYIPKNAYSQLLTHVFKKLEERNNDLRGTK